MHDDIVGTDALLKAPPTSGFRAAPAVEELSRGNWTRPCELEDVLHHKKFWKKIEESQISNPQEVESGS